MNNSKEDDIYKRRKQIDSQKKTRNKKVKSNTLLIQICICNGARIKINKRKTCEYALKLIVGEEIEWKYNEYNKFDIKNYPTDIITFTEKYKIIIKYGKYIGRKKYNYN